MKLNINPSDCVCSCNKPKYADDLMCDDCALYNESKYSYLNEEYYDYHYGISNELKELYIINNKF